MALEDKIRDLAEGLLKDDEHFLVEVSAKPSGRGTKVKILLDGDNGVTIDDCAELSRALGDEIEGAGLIDQAYTLEVSSPGVDYPLAMPRHYRKNIGRTLRIQRTDGKELKGTLEAVREHDITLSVTTGKGKNKEEVKEMIPYGEIEKAIVQISFK